MKSSPEIIRLSRQLNASLPRRRRLVHSSDSEPGILREKHGQEFQYMRDGKKIEEPMELLRIRQLAIPPAWRNVWICRNPDGHLQATGLDARNRKQYKYHLAWSSWRNQTKFGRLTKFIAGLPSLRKRMNKDLSSQGMHSDKIIATVLSLMEKTYIRIGNSEYERENGSYGLTTLKDQHVKIEGDQIRFQFRGKRGIEHKITLRNARLSRIVKQCRDIPGRELFQYYDENGTRHVLDSGMVNQYLQESLGKEFTAKDFRTWAGTLNAFAMLRKLGEAKNQAEMKRKSNEVLSFVSAQLGNTVAVCRKYYIHPLLLDLFGSRKFHERVNALGHVKRIEGLLADEVLMLGLLESK
jgi:DNA topoisomerase-1